MRAEFESIGRPTLNHEASPAGELTSPEGKSESHQNRLAQTAASPKSKRPESPKPERLDPEAELAKLESEFGKVTRDFSAEEIGGWEFDELEQELRSGEPGASK